MPQHLCILPTNHLPEITEVIPAIVERLLVVEFPVHFTDLEEGEEPTTFRQPKDNNLKKAFRAQAVYIYMYGWRYA